MHLCQDLAINICNYLMFELKPPVKGILYYRFLVSLIRVMRKIVIFFYLLHVLVHHEAEKVEKDNKLYVF